MKLTVEQISDYLEHSLYSDTVSIFGDRLLGYDKLYIHTFGHTWILDSIDEENDQAKFYCKELNASLVGKLHPYDRLSGDMFTILYLES